MKKMMNLPLITGTDRSDLNHKIRVLLVNQEACISFKSIDSVIVMVEQAIVEAQIPQYDCGHPIPGSPLGCGDTEECNCSKIRPEDPISNCLKCGGTAQLFQSDNKERWKVACCFCTRTGPFNFKKEDAIEYWNLAQTSPAKEPPQLTVRLIEAEIALIYNERESRLSEADFNTSAIDRANNRKEIYADTEKKIQQLIEKIKANQQ
jgi:hypothetical protein